MFLHFAGADAQSAVEVQKVWDEAPDPRGGVRL